jgi:hypothetical protein
MKKKIEKDKMAEFAQQMLNRRTETFSFLFCAVGK